MNLQFKYGNCDILETITPADTESLWNSNQAYQHKTLFFIKVYGNTQMIDNTFTSCNSYGGIIFLKKMANDAAILLHSNKFTKNSALSDVNAIRIDLQTTLGYDTPITATMPCSGVQISSNTFTQNVGCKNTEAAILASCYLETEMSMLEATSTGYNDPNPMSKNNTLNIQASSVSLFSTVKNVTLNGGDTVIDLNKFMLKGNTYTENYSGTIYV